MNLWTLYELEEICHFIHSTICQFSYNNFSSFWGISSFTLWAPKRIKRQNSRNWSGISSQNHFPSICCFHSCIIRVRINRENENNSAKSAKCFTEKDFNVFQTSLKYQLTISPLRSFSTSDECPVNSWSYPRVNDTWIDSSCQFHLILGVLFFLNWRELVGGLPKGRCIYGLGGVGIVTPPKAFRGSDSP